MYGLIEFFYNKKHGPPMTSANHDITEDVWGHEDRGVEAKSGSKDLELGQDEEAATASRAAHEVGCAAIPACKGMGDWVLVMGPANVRLH